MIGVSSGTPVPTRRLTLALSVIGGHDGEVSS